MSSLKANKKILSVIGLVSLIAILAFGLPYLSTDGTEKFTGKELKLAKQAIDGGYYMHVNTDPLPDLELAFKAKVTMVYKNEANKRCGDKMQGYMYMAEVDKITFFGIERPGYLMLSVR